MKMKQIANVVLCLIIFLVVGYGVKRVTEAGGIVELLSAGAPADAHAAATESVVLERAKFELNQITKQVTATFVLANRSGEEVRDVRIDCRLLARDGQNWGTGRWVVYGKIAAHQQLERTIVDQRYISHRVTADSITCQVAGYDAAGQAAAGHGQEGH